MTPAEFVQKWNTFLAMLDAEILPDEAVELAEELHTGTGRPPSGDYTSDFDDMHQPTPHQNLVLLTAFIGYFGDDSRERTAIEALRKIADMEYGPGGTLAQETLDELEGGGA